MQTSDGEGIAFAHPYTALDQLKMMFLWMIMNTNNNDTLTLHSPLAVSISCYYLKFKECTVSHFIISYYDYLPWISKDLSINNVCN